MPIPTRRSVYETTFDIDWANGLGDRPDTSLYVFDQTGRLILTARDGNIAEDRPGKPGTSSIEDLSRGTVGATDPFLGVTDLAVGTYFVAVTTDRSVANQLDQFTNRNATNPDVRLEPTASRSRAATSRTDFITGDLFDDSSVVPYHLGDVTLYVSQSTGRRTDSDDGRSVHRRRGNERRAGCRTGRATSPCTRTAGSTPTCCRGPSRIRAHRATRCRATSWRSIRATTAGGV